MIDQQVTLSIIQDILNNIDQENENRDWGQVMNLKNVTNKYSHRPDQAKDVLTVSEKLIEEFPDFDLPRIWHITALIDLDRITDALISFKKGIPLCKRKCDLYDCFSQDYFWSDSIQNINDFKLLFASSIAAFKLSSVIYFSQCFLVQYFEHYCIEHNDIIKKLKDCPISFDYQSLNQVKDFVKRYDPNDDKDIIDMINNNF